MITLMPGQVLVVDDDPAFRRLAQRMLAAAGLTLAGEADTAGAAIGLADRLRPGAFLIDVGLPDGDGITLARQLSALPWRPRIVLTSTDAEAATPADVRRSGARAFIPKDQLPNAALGPLFAEAGP
jgi:DNA-binding NarL/FixJ family response regulator